MTLADLPRLPTMNKRDARDNVEQLVWRGVPGGVFQYTTGGSSGEPLIFYFGRTRQASDAAGRMRARRWWGVEPGEREVYLWGAPVELNKTDRIKTLRDRLVNQLVLNAFAMSPERMDEYLDALQAWQPKCLYGYAIERRLAGGARRVRGSARCTCRSCAWCAPPASRFTRISANSSDGYSARRWRTNSAAATSASPRTRRRAGRCC